jgi:hypothetical protein
MSLAAPTLAPHPCAPLHPKRVATAQARGYVEWSHPDNSPWAQAQAEALTRIGARVIVEPAEIGFLILVKATAKP